MKLLFGTLCWKQNWVVSLCSKYQPKNKTAISFTSYAILDVLKTKTDVKMTYLPSFAQFTFSLTSEVRMSLLVRKIGPRWKVPGVEKPSSPSLRESETSLYTSCALRLAAKHTAALRNIRKITTLPPTGIWATKLVQYPVCPRVSYYNVYNSCLFG